MTPELVDLLKSWGAGIFWITLFLIWAIEHIATSRTERCEDDGPETSERRERDG